MLCNLRHCIMDGHPTLFYALGSSSCVGVRELCSLGFVPSRLLPIGPLVCAIFFKLNVSTFFLTAGESKRKICLIGSLCPGDKGTFGSYVQK